MAESLTPELKARIEALRKREDARSGVMNTLDALMYFGMPTDSTVRSLYGMVRPEAKELYNDTLDLEGQIWSEANAEHRRMFPKISPEDIGRKNDAAVREALQGIDPYTTRKLRDSEAEYAEMLRKGRR